MAPFGPPSPEDPGTARTTAPAFAVARLLILQRTLGTLTHELGNMTSPVALVADAIASNPSPAQQASAAGTLRIIADSLRHTTAICRMLRGNQTSGALGPKPVTDAAHWWTLIQPYVTDMLPGSIRLRARVEPVPLSTAQFEPLAWATLAAARLVSTTRPGGTELMLTGIAEGVDGRTFTLRIETAAPSSIAAPRIVRELRQLARWEAARVDGLIRFTSTPSRLAARITLPPCPD